MWVCIRLCNYLLQLYWGLFHQDNDRCNSIVDNEKQLCVHCRILYLSMVYFFYSGFLTLDDIKPFQKHNSSAFISFNCFHCYALWTDKETQLFFFFFIRLIKSLRYAFECVVFACFSHVLQRKRVKISYYLSGIDDWMAHWLEFDVRTLFWHFFGKSSSWVNLCEKL